MTEIPIIVNTNEVTVGGVVDQVELQLSLGAQGERGSRIFSGDVSPLTLPVDSPYFAGYTEFIPGDVYIERSVDVISLWEWKLQIGGYTWVKTAEVAVSNEAPEPLDQDLEAIAALAGTTGLLRKTATNTWTLDTTSYLSLSQADANYANRLATTVDNTITRFDGTGGALQGSGVTIDDGGNIFSSGSIIVTKASTAALTARSTGSEAYINVCGSNVWVRFRTTAEVDRFAIFAIGDELRVRRFDGSGGYLNDALTVYRTTGKVKLGDVGPTAGLEFGSSGPRMMMGTGGPSGISAPVGSTWRQTDANSSHGSLTGLLWNKVGTGTTEGTDWLVDYEGRWVDYAPTWTNVSMSSTTARYTRSGKQATFRCYGVLSAAPTGGVTVTSPTSMSSTGNQAHMGPVRSQPNYAWPGFWAYVGDNTMEVYFFDGSSHFASLSGTQPETWASGDWIALSGTYEI